MTSTNVCVIGLGKIGLPLACAISSSPGYKVLGLDLQEDVVEKINEGVSTVYGEPGLDKLVDRLVEEGKLRASSSYKEAVGSAQIIVIATPLFTNSENQPDYKMLDDVVDAMGPNLSKGTLIILETTVPIGTTRERIGNKLLISTGFSESDIFVAFSPERVSTGTFFRDLSNYPKVVGGVDADSTDKAADFYRSFIEFSQEARDRFGEQVVTVMESVESAEFVKLAETSYRDVNIALANQFQNHASSLGLSFKEIRDAANSQPYSHIHSPGIWVGGHCIPVYPHFYLWTDPQATLLELARDVNKKAPSTAAQILANDFPHLRESEIVVLGVAYRGGVKESAFSGVFEIVRQLKERGFKQITVSDPLFTDEELQSIGLTPSKSKDAVRGAILHTDHEEYRGLKSTDFRQLELMIDGRGSLDAKNFEGIRFISIVT